MTTYATLRNRIALELSTITTAAATPYATQIANAVLSAIQHYEREPFYFNEVSGITFSTVANQESYSSSDLAAIATLVKVQSLEVTVNSVKLPVKPMAFEAIRDWQNGAVKARPEYYAYHNQRIVLYPIPDAVYTMTMAHVKRFTALSADGDSNVWTVDAEELTRARAKGDLWANTVTGNATADAERISLAQRGEPFYSYAEKIAFNALKRETRLRRSNTILRVDEALVTPGGYNINYE